VYDITLQQKYIPIGPISNTIGHAHLPLQKRNTSQEERQLLYKQNGHTKSPKPNQIAPA
jgi:hypothetical protein